MTTSTLKSVVGSVVLSQARTNKWLLSDVMDILITVYVDCVEGSETDIEAVAQQCRNIKVKHEYSEDACIFARNREGMSKKCILQLG